VPTPTLVLVPSALEVEGLARLGGFPGELGSCERCGIGPVAASARCAERVARLAPARVLLVGIAGSFDLARHPAGSAAAFGEVLLDGVGAGSGREFRALSELGFAQWEGPPAVAERLALAGPAGAALLTVCATSASAAERDERRERYPRAAAEDMEGFGVALACRLAGVPLAIVRGFSNEVGVRDPRTWRVDAALEAARALALAWLAREWETRA